MSTDTEIEELETGEQEITHAETSSSGLKLHKLNGEWVTHRYELDEDGNERYFWGNYFQDDYAAAYRDFYKRSIL